MARLIDADALLEHIKGLPTWFEDGGGMWSCLDGYPKGLFYPEDIISSIENAPIVDAIVLPCKVGDTVYGQLHCYGREIHECKVTRIKACQFKDGSLHYFLDVEFDIIDPYYNDGRMMRCGNQTVFGEDYGNWNRVYLTEEEAEFAKMECDRNE